MRPNQQFIDSLKSQPAITFKVEATTSPSYTSLIGTDKLIEFPQNGVIKITGTGRIRILTIGGGGGGSVGTGTNGCKGGGGAKVVDEWINVTPGTYSVFVGTGGAINGGNGGTSYIQSISSVLAVGGKGTGVSGFNISPEAMAPDTNNSFSGLYELRSGGGGGYTGPSVTGPGTGCPGVGFTSDITGSVNMYGRGGGGGSYCATASYTTLNLGNDYEGGQAGWIEYGTPPVIHNAGYPIGFGDGGSGGSKSTYGTAQPYTGANGRVFIRFMEI
jgi:hypothetical protein